MAFILTTVRSSNLMRTADVFRRQIQWRNNVPSQQFRVSGSHTHLSVHAPYSEGTAPDTKSLTAVLPTIQVLCLARLVCVPNPEIKSLHFFEASVIVCQSTRCNIPEDSIVYIFSDHPKRILRCHSHLVWNSTLFGQFFDGSTGMRLERFVAVKVDCVEK
jgi:hypothetical protein